MWQLSHHNVACDTIINSQFTQQNKTKEHPRQTNETSDTLRCDVTQHRISETKRNENETSTSGGTGRANWNPIGLWWWEMNEWIMKLGADSKWCNETIGCDIGQIARRSSSADPRSTHRPQRLITVSDRGRARSCDTVLHLCHSEWGRPYSDDCKSPQFGLQCYNFTVYEWCTLPSHAVRTYIELRWVLIRVNAISMSGNGHNPCTDDPLSSSNEL